eukprot:3442106-Rhodomonas_salina.1
MNFKFESDIVQAERRTASEMFLTPQQAPHSGWPQASSTALISLAPSDRKCYRHRVQVQVEPASHRCGLG